MLLFGVLAGLIVAPQAAGGAEAPRSETQMAAELWAVEVTGAFSGKLRPSTALRLRAAGINALVPGPRLNRGQLAHLRSWAPRWGFELLTPISGSRRLLSSPEGVARACQALAQASPGRWCIVRARSLATANRLAAAGVADLIVARFRSPVQLRKIVLPVGGRILAVSSFARTKRFAGREWQQVIRLASVNTQLDFAVSSSSARKLTKLMRVLRNEVQRRATLTSDTTAPTPPYIRAAGSSRDSVWLSWRAVRDSSGVGAYLLFRNGEFFAMTAGTRARHEKLACGTRYSLAVQAVDVAGNRSAMSPLEIGTRACAPGSLPAPAAPTPAVDPGAASPAPASKPPEHAPAPSSTSPTPAHKPAAQPPVITRPPAPPSSTPSDPAPAPAPSPALPTSPPPSPTPAPTPPSPSPPESSGKAFVSPAGSDSNPCSQTQPCASFNKAYRVARPGTLVEVAGGSYPEQRIDFDPSKTSPDDVVFAPASGARVEISDSLIVLGAHLEFRDMTVKTFQAQYRTDVAGYRAEDVTFRNLTARGCFLNAPQDVSILGGVVGPNFAGSDDGCYIGAYPSTRVPTNITIDGVLFRDILESTSGRADPHSDCVQITAGANVTVRNSRFQNCDDADLMIQTAQGPLSNITIENNFLDDTNLGYWSINLEASTACSNIVIRNNSALENIRVDSCAGNGLVFQGNIQPSMTQYLCSLVDGVADWNVYETGVKCGANDLVGAVNYANRSAFDLRLVSGAARDRITASGVCAPTDIEGESRNRGPCDAGADES